MKLNQCSESFISIDKLSSFRDPRRMIDQIASRLMEDNPNIEPHKVYEEIAENIRINQKSILRNVTDEIHSKHTASEQVKYLLENKKSINDEDITICDRSGYCEFRASVEAGENETSRRFACLNQGRCPNIHILIGNNNDDTKNDFLKRLKARY